MKYTAERLGLEAAIEDWTREHSNVWINLENQGRTCAFNLGGDLIREDLSLLNYEDWHKIPQFAGLELRKIYDNVVSGSDDFLRRHGYDRVGGKYRCIEPNNEKIAVFCHGGFGLTWLAHLLEIPLPLVWSGFWLPTTSVTTILFDERSAGWAVPRCLGLGDVSHLYEAGLPVLPRGIVANYE
jgi:probable phosphoglycerate mutase